MPAGQQGREQRPGRQVGGGRPGPVGDAGDDHGAATFESGQAGLGHALGRLPHEPWQGGQGLGAVEPRRLGELGVDGAGAEGGDRHAGASQLAAQRVAVREHERLGRRVRRLTRQGLEGGGRRDVEHRAAAPLDHAGQEQAAEVGEGFDVGADHRHLGAWVAGVHRPDRAEPGRVHEHGHREPAFGDRGGEAVARRLAGQVGGCDLDPHAVGIAQLAGQRLQAVLAPGHQRHPVAAPGELPGDRAADARGGAGDQGRAVARGRGQRHRASVATDRRRVPIVIRRSARRRCRPPPGPCAAPATGARPARTGRAAPWWPGTGP